MASLKEIRNRIQSVSSTQKITKAMKLVAASKMRKANEVLEGTVRYSNKLNDIVSNVASGSSEQSSPLVDANTSNKVLFVLVTSNKGLAGAFNTNAIKCVEQTIKAEYAHLDKSDIYFLCIGKKGADYFSRRYPNVKSEIDVFKEIHLEAIREAGEEVMADFVAKKYGKVELIYNSFKSTATQVVERELLLPFGQNGEDNKDSESNEFILEPSSDAFLEAALPKAILVQMLKAIVDSNAAEQAARMLAMSSATDNAQELIRSLSLAYNQARQATVTKELLEIVSGANALEDLE